MILITFSIKLTLQKYAFAKEGTTSEYKSSIQRPTFFSTPSTEYIWFKLAYLALLVLFVFVFALKFALSRFFRRS